MESNLVTLRQIADRMGLDRSNARKWILDRGYTFMTSRDLSSGNQAVSVLSEEEAEEVLRLRSDMGFVVDGKAEPSASENGAVVPMPRS